MATVEVGPPMHLADVGALQEHGKAQCAQEHAWLKIHEGKAYRWSHLVGDIAKLGWCCMPLTLDKHSRTSTRVTVKQPIMLRWTRTAATALDHRNSIMAWVACLIRDLWKDGAARADLYEIWKYCQSTSRKQA